MLPSFESYLENGCIGLTSYRQGWGVPQFNKDLMGKGPVKIAGRTFGNGISSHANCELNFKSAQALKHFKAFVGISDNSHTSQEKIQPAPMSFSVVVNGQVIGECTVPNKKQLAVLECDFPADAYDFALVVHSNDISSGHVSFADVKITLENGHECNPFANVVNINLAPSPISFQYGNLSAVDFFHKYPFKIVEKNKGEDSSYTLISEGEGLQVKVKLNEYGKYPVWEWHTSVKNVGTARSPRLSKVNVLDFCINLQKLVNYTIHRRRGSQHVEDEELEYPARFTETYQPVVAKMRDVETINMRNEGGRPTEAWLPYVDISNDSDDSMRLVIGWAGQWRMSVSHLKDSAFNINAGLEDLDAVLEPGEELTLPSMYLLHSSTNYEKMINIWRRFVTEKVMTPFNGKAPQGQVFYNHWGGISAKEQMDCARNIVENDLPCEVYWIDAGWYAPRSKNEFEPIWGNYTGDWKFNAEQYPNELKDLSAYLHEHGRKLLLWFEPERVVATSQLAKEHPEWLIEKSPTSRDRLLNIGNPDVWKWCHDTLAGIIRRNNLDWFREDFNISPLPYWRKNDAPDRKGITEIRFNEELYRLWKTLREEFPNLMIDNCSSGGRRLDIELLRYSMPLWISDMHCDGYDPEWGLAQCVWLGNYWPRMGIASNKSKDVDVFTFRCALCSSIDVHISYSGSMEPDTPTSYDVLKKCINDQIEVRDLIGCDFYELSPVIPHGNPWAILQYNSPEEQRGAIFAFRSIDSCVTECKIRPKELLPDAMYEVTDVDGLLTPCKISGSELMKQGISLQLPPRGSAIIKYKQHKY